MRIGLPSTVRFRVTALATLAVIAVLVVASVALVSTQRRLLTESLDEDITGRVNELAEAIAAGETPPLTNLGEDDSVAQIVTMDGDVLAASPTISGDPPIGPSITRGQTFTRSPPLGKADGDMRVLSRVVPSPRGNVVIHFAGTTDDLDASVATLRRSLTVAVPAVAAVLAALTWLLVGRTLRPVERIRAGVAAIGGTDLDRRVPEPPGDDEVTRLARTMNEMLARIGEASARQRRFVADASHELRSPLARMRAELEVDITHPQTAEPVVTQHSVLEEVVGLQQLVDDLLLLARDAEIDPRRARRDDPVDVSAVVHDAARRAVGRELAVEVVADPVRVTGDRGELTRAVGNLVDNAARHAQTSIRLDVASRNGDVTIAVSDDGPGIPAADRERIFERFARLDESRSPEHGGAGLGLSIAREIVERHGGTISVDPDYRAGARFTITLRALPG